MSDTERTSPLDGPGAESFGPPPSPAILARDLTRAFGAFTAVDRVTFEVARGEVFGFLGPNGAGKTTTLKMLTGLLTPTSGEGRVAGLDIASEQTAIRGRIGYMSQKFSLYTDLTVAENLDLFAGLYGVTGTRFYRRRAWALELAGLTGQERRLTAELPLGWKQRLALGCAVLHEPEILFLDEPTSGVDPLARRAFWDLIRALADAGTTIIVSTHYMEEAEYCDRLILMNRGRLIAEGTPATLRDSLTEPIYHLEVDDAPRAAQLLLQTPGVLDAAIFGRAVHLVLEPVMEPGIYDGADSSYSDDLVVSGRFAGDRASGSPADFADIEIAGGAADAKCREYLDASINNPRESVPSAGHESPEPVTVSGPAETRALTDLLTQILARDGLTCHGVRRITPSLEDVFVSLVRREGGAVLG